MKAFMKQSGVGTLTLNLVLTKAELDKFALQKGKQPKGIFDVIRIIRSVK